MIRNLLVFALFATSSCVVLYGQNPETKKVPEKGANIFTLAFDGDGSYLGIQTQEVSKENFAKFGLRDIRGVAVEKVMDNSPAAAAGLQAGDVIVRFEGEEVTGTRKLTRLISEVAPDHQAKLTIIRGGSEREMTVTLAKRPTPKFEDGNFEWSTPMPPGDLPKMGKMPDMSEFPKLQGVPGFKVEPNSERNTFFFSSNSRQIGVSLTSLTKQLGDYFGVADGNGLLISSVRENSPAAKAGLKAGDVIVEVDGKGVKGDFDILRTLNEKKEGDVELTIVRDRSRQTVRVTPEIVKGENGTLFEQFNDKGLFAPMKTGPGQPGMIATPAPFLLNMPGRVL